MAEPCYIGTDAVTGEHATLADAHRAVEAALEVASDIAGAVETVEA